MTTEYYKEKLEQGLQYQDFVYDEFYKIGITTLSYSSKKYQVEYGENRAGIEIKFDGKTKETGNIYIEIAEKSNENNNEYYPSGIYRDDNTWLYVIGDYSIIYIFAKKQLKTIYEKENYKKAGGSKKETTTSKGFVFPTSYAEKAAIKIIKI